MKDHPLTPEYSRFGTFDMLRESAREQLKELILNLAQHPDAKVSGTIAQKVSDLYAMGMDEKRLNEEGVAPLKPLLDRIAYADTSKREELLAWQHGGIGGSFFNTGVGPDVKNSDIYILHIGEVGLGLGDRDFYLEKSDRNDEILAAYRVYVKRLMELIGYDDESQNRVWETVIKIETELARHMMTREECRDPMNRFHMMSIEELKDKFPDFNWDEYLRLLNMGNADKTNVANPGFIDFVTSFIKSLTPQEIRDFMTFETVSDATGLLSDDFGNASFELYGRVMSGQEERKPRWKRA
ncbi:MAG: M13 family metallopeptidase, partial [Allobaculum sp.]|nr:M13 family metallopeptidase [Allobaculum sp.]